MSAVRGAGVVSACTAACTPESLLELCALDRACGLGCCAEPGSGVRPVFGVVTPHRRSNSARYFRVENSRCLGLPGAGGVEVMKGGFFFGKLLYPKKSVTIYAGKVGAVIRKFGFDKSGVPSHCLKEEESSIEFRTRPNTRFICVRYGNALASLGSVIPLFYTQTKDAGPVTITFPKRLVSCLIISELRIPF